MTIRNMENSEYELSIEFSARCFGGGQDMEEYFRSRYKVEPEHSMSDHIVAEIDGKIVGHIAIFKKNVLYYGQPLLMGDIANVCTIPEERGKGIASQLMKHALDKMRKEGYVLSSLGGRPKFYSRFGFNNIAPEVQVEFKAKNTGTVLRLFEPDDVEWMLELYNSEIKGKTGPLVRESKYFQSLVKYIKEFYALVLKDRSGYIYLNMVKSGNYLEIMEIMGINEESIIELLKGVMNYAESVGCKKVILHCPVFPDMKFRRALISLSDEVMSETLALGRMWRIVDLGGFLKEAKDIFSERVKEDFFVAIKTEDGTVNIRYDKGLFQFKNESSEDIYETSVSTLTDIVLGELSPQEAINLGLAKTNLEDRKLEILSSLFPITRCYISHLDMR